MAMYGHRSRTGSIAIRFAAIIAAALFVAGMLNGRGGNWVPAVGITPAPTRSAGPQAQQPAAGARH